MGKTRFRELCEQDPTIPIFLRHEWISTVAANENWGVVFSGDPKSPKGFLVYFLKRKFGVKKITLPPLTPYLGPWIYYPHGQKTARKHGYEKQVMEELIDQLPSFDEAVLQFHPSIRNSLPFYWKGYQETMRYTYRIDTQEGLEHIFNGMRGNIRRAIRKAEKKMEVQGSTSIDELHDLKLADYEEKGEKLNYDRAYFRRIDELLAPNGQRDLLYAIDENGRVHGGIYLIYGPYACYYLIGAVDPSLKDQGAMSLLMWKGIEKAQQKGLIFDFEGSMIEPIERFFRSFGAEQVPYHQVSKTSSLISKSRKALKILRGTS